MGQKYKGQKKLKFKQKFWIIILILIVVLCIFLNILATLINEKNEKEQAIMSGQFSSVEDILEYYGCTFVKMVDSSEDGFSVDIYTKFKYDLYDDEKSNEQFYNNVINEIAKFLNYDSFRMIDKSKEDEIEIKVVCANNAVQTIYINGIEDYFIFMDSQLDLSKYKELKTVDLLVQAPELQNCIQNNWATNTEFGTRDTIFQDYFIYFDEGIKTRKISGKIYNIVFTNKYQNSVVNGFTVGTESDIIIRELGVPTFQNDDKSIIGYKSNDIYVFFEKNQISVYRNIQEEGFDEFFELTDKLISDEYSLLEFMNELTDIWPDYDEYTYDSQTIFLSYPNKGIDVKLNYENIDGIVLYNNVGVSQDVVKDYLKHTEFVAQLQIDNVYNAEKRRFEKESNWSKECKEYKEKFEAEDDRNRGKLYNYYMNMDSNDNIMNVYFISKDENYPNCELNENIDTYIWINDYCFVYSKAHNGIYFYDLRSQAKGILITGKDNYKIKSYDNGILKYDEDNTLEIQN